MKKRYILIRVLGGDFMKKIEWDYDNINNVLNFLVSAFLQIAVFLFIILLLEFFLINLQLSPATPRRIIYVEALILYLIGRVAKIIVETFRKDD